MNIPESAIKPFEPLGIPRLESDGRYEALLANIDDALTCELRKVILENNPNRNHQQIAERFCNAARTAGASHTGYSLDKSNLLVEHYVVYVVRGVKHIKHMQLAL